MNELINRLDKRSELYRASKLIHDYERAELRQAVIDALNAGYKVADLTDVAGFSRQNLYEIANSLGVQEPDN